MRHLWFLEKKRWCVNCLYSKGIKSVEDENHVLIHCPLYSSIRTKFHGYPESQHDLAGLLSDQNVCPKKLLLLPGQSIQFCPPMKAIQLTTKVPIFIVQRATV